MANNYELFSESFTLPAKAVHDAEQITKALRSGRGPDGSYEGMPDWVTAEVMERFDQAAPYYEYGVGETNIDGMCDLYVWSGDGNASASGLACVLSIVLAHYYLPDKLTLQVAYTCDKPRIGEFGGGAYCITKEGVYYVGTSELAYLLPEIRKVISDMEAKHDR